MYFIAILFVLTGVIQFNTTDVPFNPKNPRAVYQLQPTVSDVYLQYGADVTEAFVENLEVR